jgi:hypothetical protein
MVDSSSLTLPEDPKEVEKVFNSLEREGLRRQHLLAFQDFCLTYWKRSLERFLSREDRSEIYEGLLVENGFLG